jgi:antitoxin component YwqK of YwqJK toxin-antitoxin module
VKYHDFTPKNKKKSNFRWGARRLYKPNNLIQKSTLYKPNNLIQKSTLYKPNNLIQKSTLYKPNNLDEVVWFI